jgi:hypothetical protein
MHAPSRFLLVIFEIGTAFQSRAWFVFECGCCNEREKRNELLGPFQFRSQGEQVCFGGEFARMLGVQSNASEVMTNAKAHHVVTSELLAGETIAGFFIHLPSPGQILVGDPFMGEMAVGLASGQNIPDQFDQPCPFSSK